MLSKRTKKKISKAKRTTKRYLTKIGIRKPRKNPENLMPFLWSADIKDRDSLLAYGLDKGKYYVLISTYVYKPLYDPYLTGVSKHRYALIPDIHTVREQHEFDTEQQALDFIKKWWSKQ